MEQFCTATIPTLCSLAEQCQTFDTDCASLAAVSLLGIPTGCSAPGLSLNAGAASACESSLQAALTNGDCTALSAALSPDYPQGPCALAVRGSLPEGAACTRTVDCSLRPDGGLTSCEAPTSTGCGTCTAGDNGELCLFGRAGKTCVHGMCEIDSVTCYAFVPEGGACGSETEFCNAGDYCDTSSGTCLPLATDGQPCPNSGQECVAPDFCGLASDGGPVCMTPVGTGESCADRLCVAEDVCLPGPDGGLACQVGASLMQPCTGSPGQGSCAPNLVCDSISSLCLALGAGQGEACSPHADEFDNCGSGFSCDAPDGGLGSCVASPTLGQPCSPPSIACFGAGLMCLGGTCQQPPASGAPCADAGDGFATSCRAGAYCDPQGTCQLLIPLGGACTPAPGPSGCANGYCDASGTCVALLAPGEPCDPYAFQCSRDASTFIGADGGVMATDTLCENVLVDGGSVCGATYTCP